MNKEKFTVGTTLRKILLSNTELQTYISNKIYPLIAPENTSGDFIVYKRNNYKKDYTKEYLVVESCTIAFIIVADNYDKSQQIALLVNDILENTVLEDNTNIRLIESNEDYIDEKYIQELIFNIE